MHRLRQIDQNALVDLMANSNTMVSRHDILVVLDLMERTITEQLCLGNSIRVMFFKARLGVKGGFRDENDEFTLGRHRLRLLLSCKGTFNRKLTVNARPVKINPSEKLPEIRTHSIADVVIPEIELHVARL